MKTLIESRLTLLANLNISAYLFVGLMLTSNSAMGQEGNQSVAPGVANSSTQDVAETAGFYPPLWEKNHPERRAWSEDAMNAIESFAPHLVAGSADVTLFCPKYAKLNLDQRLNFWAYFISTVAVYESQFVATDRYLEDTLGTDPVTHQAVYSEGLLQLSYGDVRSYPFCEFDWSRDRYLSPTDPSKTIFDPNKNLSCGIRILDAQVARHGQVSISHGAYWSTLQTGGRYNRLASIEKLTKQIPFCH